jgi:methylated-DNA-[protein]-cysteine S-methyltransferase
MKHMITLCQTQAGWVGLLLSPRGLRALEYPRPSPEAALANLQERWPEAPFEQSAAEELKEQLRRYYAGEPVTFAAKLDLEGYTHFERKVWAATSRIPYGQRRPYSWVAKEVGSPRSYRAVGAALAKNPIPIIIPCHRVLRKDGSLGGYGGGLDMKLTLLKMEARGT